MPTTRLLEMVQAYEDYASAAPNGSGPLSQLVQHIVVVECFSRDAKGLECGVTSIHAGHKKDATAIEFSPSRSSFVCLYGYSLTPSLCRIDVFLTRNIHLIQKRQF